MRCSERKTKCETPSKETPSGAQLHEHGARLQDELYKGTDDVSVDPDAPAVRRRREGSRLTEVTTVFHQQVQTLRSPIPAGVDRQHVAA
ncbi:hypothetical protein IMZ48_20315 [Candidatus Bathyarchaeota archaeon]|nr:hypothetical protein [Candidatus Bathyarchaeota archaeon]